MSRNLVAALLVVLAFVPASVAAQEPTSPKNRVKSTVEVGFLDPMSHKIQLSEAGSYFDYVSEGGQDVLFFFTRLGLDWSPNGRHHLMFLYQPIKIEGRTVLQRDLVVDDATFAAGTALNTTYGFPFYRLSYLYDVAPADDLEVSFGASLQLRNATIIFESGDGTLRRSRRDVGPVPILKARFRKDVGAGYFVGAEADGFYAPISYLNGDDNEVVGAIGDISLRAGRTFADGKLDMYLNARYLGGGAVGASDDFEGPGGDGYVRNWLHFATISVGVDYDWTNGL